MTLPTSGPLSLTDIQTEFGGTNPISLNEYYAGGGLVPSGTTGTNGAVPSSGAISINSFYGTSNVRNFGYFFSERTDILPSGRYFGGIAASAITSLGEVVFRGSYGVVVSGSAAGRGMIGTLTASNGTNSVIKTNSNTYTLYSTLLSLDASNNIYYVNGNNAGTGVVINKTSSSSVYAWGYSCSGITGVNSSLNISSSGNIFTGGWDIPTSTGTTNRACIAKINSTTTPTFGWARTIVTGTSPLYVTYQIVTDSSENVYAVGYGFNSSTGGSLIGFIVKYNSSGTLQWQRRVTAGGLVSCALDSSNNLYVIGTDDVGGTGGWLAKYNTSGTIQWQRQIGGFRGEHVAVSPSGDVYAAVTVSGGGVIWVAKYNTSGTQLFVYRIRISPTSGASSSSLSSINVFLDSSEKLYVSGIYFQSESPSREAGYVFKLNNDGTSALASTLVPLPNGINISAEITTLSASTVTGTLTEAAGSFTFANVTYTVSSENQTPYNQAIPTAASETFTSTFVTVT
jgi:hypothetical protein